MGNTLIKTIILISWLVSMAWLVRYEAYPYLFDGTVQGYRELSNNLPAMRDTWMKVFAEGDHVGYLNSSIEIEDAEGNEELVMSTQLMLRILFQGQPETLRFRNKVRLNARHELQSSESGFFLAGISGDLNLTPQGEPGSYQLAIEVNDLKFARSVTIPSEAVISSPLMDQGLRAVRPGQVLRIRALDPFSMSGELQTIELQGISSEVKVLPGESQPLTATRVETRFGEIVLESEVDQFGRIIWQQTPFGLTLVLSDPQQAMKVPDKNALDPKTLFSSPLFRSFLPENTFP